MNGMGSSRSEEILKIGKTLLVHTHEKSELITPTQRRIRNGCIEILQGAKILRHELPWAEFEIRLPSSLAPCIIDLQAQNDHFKATILPYKAAKIENNGFDVSDVPEQSVALLNHVIKIYRDLRPE